MIDSRDIAELHPTLQLGCKELIKRMTSAGYANLAISSSYRCHDYQNYLYDQGWTRSGSIVTNARGGESMHNFRLAFDIFKNIKGQEYNEQKFFKTAGDIWVAMGGVWGGNWTAFVDYPHFEYSGGLSLKDLQSGKTLPQNARMRWQPPQAQEVEEEMKRYNTLAEIPAWAQPTIQKLINKKIIQGNDASGNALDLTLDMIRIFVAHDRAGIYD